MVDELKGYVHQVLYDMFYYDFAPFMGIDLYYPHLKIGVNICGPEQDNQLMALCEEQGIILIIVPSDMPYNQIAEHIKDCIQSPWI